MNILEFVPQRVKTSWPGILMGGLSFVAFGCESSKGRTPTACEKTPILGGEIVGLSKDSSLHGLVFRKKNGAVRKDEQVKIVWRMTGRGNLKVTSLRPDGSTGELAFGPEPHLSSSFARPGDEWGTGFKFDQIGCWHLKLDRAEGHGDVWVLVEQ